MENDKKPDFQPKKEEPKPDEPKTDPKKEPAKEIKPISPEILDLAEKVAGDPKSRLFVHLAEEYLKIDMVEEALSVLNDGLKAHPNFLSAKVMLGRAKFEKGDVPAAKSIFEEVAAVHPDNLLVQRKLAVIYRNEGLLEQAKSASRAVLALNPKDEEMLSVSREIEEMKKARGGPVDFSGNLEGTPEMVVEQTSHTGGRSPEISPLENPGAPETEAPPGEVPREPLMETPQTGKPGTEGSQALGSSLLNPDGTRDNEEVKQESLLETNSFPEPSPVKPVSPIPVDLPDVPSLEPQPPVERKPLEEMNSEALADLYISQGHVEKGVAIFRKLLAEDPGNQGLHRKLEEAVRTIRGKDASVNITGAPSPSGRQEGSPPSSSGVESGSKGEGSSKNAEKVKRLQNWLDSIRKGQKE